MLGSVSLLLGHIARVTIAMAMRVKRSASGITLLIPPTRFRITLSTMSAEATLPREILSSCIRLIQTMLEVGFTALLAQLVARLIVHTGIIAGALAALKRQVLISYVEDTLFTV